MQDKISFLRAIGTAKGVVASAALACIMLSLTQTAAPAAESEKLNVFYSSIAATSMVTWIPKEAGIYNKYGLDVNLIYVVGSQAVSTLVSGDAHIGQGSGAAAVLSRLAGSDVAIIGTPVNVIQMTLIAARDINKPTELKGKTLGVSRFGSLTDLGLRRAVREFGLDPTSDIKVIQTGCVPEILQFLEQGVIKGGLVSSPTREKARELGYKEFLDLTEIDYRYPSTALLATDTFIKNRPETLNRFLKATVEGIKYAKANPEFTMRVVAKHTRVNDNKALTGAFKGTVMLFRDFPVVTQQEMVSVLDSIAVGNPKAKGVDSKQFYNNAPLEQLVKEGFVKDVKR
jgi:ABC-type nitrate/sulfonate/bicarbonate transport system substrate-binding protein